MHPSVSEYIILVNLFLTLCVAKFFNIKNFILFFSQNNRVLVNKISRNLYKLKAKSVRPNIIPSRIKKKICKMSEKLADRSASGSK